MTGRMKTQGLLAACALVLACRSSTEPDAGRRRAAPQRAVPRVDVPPPPPSVSPEMAADPSGGAASALRAAMGNLPAATPLPSTLIVDLDGDHAMEVLARDEQHGCFLARRAGGAWRAQALGVEAGDNDQNVRCLDPLVINGRILLPATGGGMTRDAATSAVTATSVGVTLWGLVGAELRAVWSEEITDAQNDDGYRFTPLGGEGFSVARTVHGVTKHRALALTEAGAVEVRSCWAPMEPRALPTPPAGCTARPGRAATLFANETDPEGTRVDLGEAGVLTVVQPGAATRSGARSFCVAAPDGGVVGYAFLTAQQLRGCPSVPDGGAP
jgi:hypothetical protein